MKGNWKRRIEGRDLGRHHEWLGTAQGKEFSSRQQWILESGVTGVRDIRNHCKEDEIVVRKYWKTGGKERQEETNLAINPNTMRTFVKKKKIASLFRNTGNQYSTTLSNIRTP